MRRGAGCDPALGLAQLRFGPSSVTLDGWRVAEGGTGRRTKAGSGWETCGSKASRTGPRQPWGAALLCHSDTQWAPLCHFQKGTPQRTPFRLAADLWKTPPPRWAGASQKAFLCPLLADDWQRVPPLGTHYIKVSFPQMSPGSPSSRCYFFPLTAGRVNCLFFFF